MLLKDAGLLTWVIFRSAWYHRKILFLTSSCGQDEGNSEIQKRDVKNILMITDDIDFNYLRDWSKRLSVDSLLEECRSWMIQQKRLQQPCVINLERKAIRRECAWALPCLILQKWWCWHRGPIFQLPRKERCSFLGSMEMSLTVKLSKRYSPTWRVYRFNSVPTGNLGR